MRLELELLHQRLRTTSLYVTHDQVEAMTLADRMIVLNEGWVERIGTPEEDYAHPASRFVAGFIGSLPMNLLPLVASSNAIRLADGEELMFGPAARALLPAELPARFLLGVRPEHLVPTTAAEALLGISIRLLENQGADRFAHGRIGKYDVIVRLPASQAAKAGEVLTLTARPADLHHFDIDTGKRIQT